MQKPEPKLRKCRSRNVIHTLYRKTPVWDIKMFRRKLKCVFWDNDPYIMIVLLYYLSIYILYTIKYMHGVLILFCGLSTNEAIRAPCSLFQFLVAFCLLCDMLFPFFLSLDTCFFLWRIYYESQNVLRF